MTAEQAMARAKEAADSGKLGLASSCYRKAIELAPEDPSLWLQYAECELKQGREDNAREAIRRAHHLAPEQSLIQRVIGRLQLDLGEFKLAEQTLQRSIAIEPIAAAYIYLHIAFIRQGKAREAEDALKRALELEPDNEEAHYNLGVFYKLDRRLDPNQRLHLAERHLLRAIEIDKGHSAAFAELGHIEFGKERYVEAEKLLKESIRMDPQRFWTRVYLAETYWALGDLRKADAEFREAIRIEPQYVFGLALYGDFLSVDGGEPERGERYLRKAISEEPDDTTFQFFLGRSLLHQNRAEEARGFLRQAADNGHPRAKRLLEQLDRESTP